MSDANSMQQQPSVAQVQAWLSTVIRPIAAAVEIEREFASKGNWTFRSYTQSFEYLRPVAKMVSTFFHANLRQLWRYDDSFKGACESHDRSLDELRNAARAAYRSLSDDPDFRALAAPIPQDDHDYLAEYVINGLREIAASYRHADFWKNSSVRFHALRQSPRLVPAFAALDNAGATFARAADVLFAMTIGLQDRLSDDFKLPPVDPNAAGLV